MMDQRARDPRPRRFDPTLLLAFLLPVFAWAPLTYPGYFVFRSGFLPLFNLADRLTRLGDPSWTPTVGRGYSLFGGEGALPYLLAALPAALGASPVNAVKLVMAASFVAGSAGAYAWTRRRFADGWPALLAAALYVLNPIWLPAVYARGAFSEAVLLGIMPWMLWAADAAMGGRRGAAVLLAVLVAAALWTQAGMALAFAGIVLAYVLVLSQAARTSTRQITLPLIGLAIGLVVGALGMLPVVLRRGVGALGWPGPEWLTLLVPWLALLGGWIAARLAAMLPESEAGARPPLYAALIGLALLVVYPDLHPVAVAGPIPSAPVAIFGENEIALLSVQTEGMPVPGRRVALDVEWQALRPLARDYTVFFHVIAGNDQRYGQLDTMPQSGKLPTTQWQPGEVVQDRYEATISPDAPAVSDYRYWLGWYFGPSGERLSESQGSSARPGDKYIVEP